jgi:Flp pilus assembly CpaF family ATPase
MGVSLSFTEMLAKKLPVHQQMSEFLTMFNGDSQFIVLSGETGSGKTKDVVVLFRVWPQVERVDVAGLRAQR